MIEIVNRQRAFSVAPSAVSCAAHDFLRARALATVPPDLEIAFLSEARIRELNRTYRGKDRSTDVLSFAGALALCPARIESNVIRVFGLAPTRANLSRELHFLVLHGLLHLAGHDHGDDYEASPMARVAARILRGRAIPTRLLWRTIVPRSGVVERAQARDRGASRRSGASTTSETPLPTGARSAACERSGGSGAPSPSRNK